MTAQNAESRPDIAAQAASVTTLPELGRLLRDLKRREARSRGGPELTHRQIAARVGCSAVSVTYYLRGDVLPAVERFDALVRCLGATPAERAALAAALDRIAEDRRGAIAPGGDRTIHRVDSVPRSLPAPPSPFTGRTAQLAHLDDALTGSADSTAVVVISGMGGVGKSALALYWAHRSADRFPDGQVFINLRGFDPREPLTAAEALRELLIALGVAPADVPSDLADCTHRYHAQLAGRRMLILLDNAADAAQVRPLLPPAPCMALITSRDRLDELVPAEGAGRLPLDVLTKDEAVALLRTLIDERGEREPQSVRRLAHLCGCLPLALRVAAELVRSRPGVALADLVQELAVEPGGDLDIFDTGDVRTDVRHVLSWSVRSLPPAAERAFMLAGLTVGDTFDAWALAALAGGEPAEAEQLLEVLHRAHLIQRRDGRYGLHELVRAYAVELGQRKLSPGDQRDARQRLADYYLTAATAAMRVSYPGSTIWPRSYPPPLNSPAVPELSTVEAAGAWLEAERDALVRLSVEAASLGLPAHGVALALTLRLFLNNRHSQDSFAVHTAALAAATQLDTQCDPADRAGLRVGLGVATVRLGRLDEAEEHLERAVTEYSEIGNHAGILAGLAALGALRMTQGRLHDALDWMRRSLEVTRLAGRRVNEGGQLCNLASAHLALEQYDEAVALCRAGIAILADEGSDVWLAHGHSLLAIAFEGLGRYEEAIHHGHEALTLARSTGFLEAEVQANVTLGSLDRRLGRPDEAIGRLTTALHLARPTGRRGLVARVLNALGEAHLAADAAGPALACHVEAAELAEGAGERMEFAAALVGIGDTHARLGQDADAADSWRQAEEIYAQMRHPAVERVRARLASLVDGDVRPAD